MTKRDNENKMLFESDQYRGSDQNREDMIIDLNKMAIMASS